MLVQTIIAPAAAPQIPAAQPPPAPASPRLDRVDLELLNAIGENGRYGIPLWAVINWIADEHSPGSRDATRAFRLELWQRLKRLLHAGLVFRFGRKNVTLVKLPPIARRRARRARRPSVRQAASLNTGSTISPATGHETEVPQKPIHFEAVRTKPQMPNPVRQVQKTESAATPIQVSDAARKLASLPRQQQKRFTGWLNRQHCWRGRLVVIPSGEAVPLIWCQRGRVLVQYPDDSLEFLEYLRRAVLREKQVRFFRHPAAVLLGSRKKGVRETPSERKRLACRQNGCRACQNGKRRGRPPQVPKPAFV